MERLGQRIKKHREELGIMTGVLAKTIGVSASSLSQIERGKIYPSVVTLKKISVALHTTVSELIGEQDVLLEHPLMRARETALVRKNASGAELYALTHRQSLRQMDVFLLKLARAADGEGFTAPRRGQEFMRIEKGRIAMTLGGQEMTMYAGDNIYYDASAPRSIRNIHRGVSEIVWVATPVHEDGH